MGKKKEASSDLRPVLLMLEAIRCQLKAMHSGSGTTDEVMLAAASDSYANRALGEHDVPLAG